MFRRVGTVLLFWAFLMPVFAVAQNGPEIKTTAVTDCSGVVISEFIPNPVGVDSDGEWIELYNQTNSEVNLNGYSITDTEGTTHKYSISNATIAAGGFAVFDRETTGITLNNDKESLILTKPEGASCQTDFAKDTVNPKEGNSFAYDFNSKSWKWTTTPTPGSENVFTVDNTASNPASGSDDVPAPPPQNSCAGIMITELMPAPAGSDSENEWIEIYNSNGNATDIGGCTLTDRLKAGSTTKYTFPAGTSINSGEYKVLTRPVTKISLNNDSDGVMLLASDGTAVFDTGLYKNAKENIAYAYSDGQWFWTSTPTPGAPNVITDPPPKATKNPKSTKNAAKTAKSNKSSGGTSGQVLGDSTNVNGGSQKKISDKVLGYILVIFACLTPLGYLIYWKKVWILDQPIVQKVLSRLENIKNFFVH